MATADQLNDGVLERMGTDAVLADSVFEGETEKTGLQRYAVVFANIGVREQARFTGPSSMTVMTFTIHSVGRTAAQAKLVAARVDERLTDFVLEVDGWNCHSITHPVSLQTQIDRDGPERLHYNVDEFVLVAERT